MFSVPPYEHPSLSQQQTAFHLWCFGSAKLITLIMVFEMCVRTVLDIDSVGLNVMQRYFGNSTYAL